MAFPFSQGSIGGLQYVQGSDGNQVPADSLPKTYGYTGDNLTTTTITYGDATYVKTYSYSGSYITSDSGWIKQ